MNVNIDDTLVAELLESMFEEVTELKDKVRQYALEVDKVQAKYKRLREFVFQVGGDDDNIPVLYLNRANQLLSELPL